MKVPVLLGLIVVSLVALRLAGFDVEDLPLEQDGTSYTPIELRAVTAVRNETPDDYDPSAAWCWDRYQEIATLWWHEGLRADSLQGELTRARVRIAELETGE